MSKGNNMSRDSKLPVASAKQINEQHRLAIQSAENAIEHAIMCGQMLVDKKASLAHGEFLAWIEKNCDFAISTATRYMKAARSSDAVNLSSLRQIFPSAKPKQLPNVDKVQIPTAVAICDKTAAEKAPFTPPVDAKFEPPQTVETETAEPCRGGAPTVDHWEPEEDEAAQLEQAERDYAASIDKVMAADDKLAAAHEEIKRQAAEIATLKLARNQYQNQCAELIRKVKSLQRLVDKKQGNAVNYAH